MNVRKASLRPSVAGSGSSSTMGFISYYRVFVEEKPLISTAATQPTCRNFYQTLQPSLKFETVTQAVFNVAKIVIQGQLPSYGNPQEKVPSAKPLKTVSDPNLLQAEGPGCRGVFGYFFGLALRSCYD